MTTHREKRNRILLGAIVLVFLVATTALTYRIGQTTPFSGGIAPKSSKVGESSFIDVQEEFSSGNSSSEQGLALSYAWVNTGDSQVVLLATFGTGGGPLMEGIVLPSPVSVIIGEHFNTSQGEVFVANTPTFMEIYNDSNHNGVPDSDFDHHSSEIIYYIVWNASQSFHATPAEKQVDEENVAHYRWSVRYGGVAGLLIHPFFDEQDRFPILCCWIDYVECSYDYYLRENNSYLKVGFAASPLADIVVSWYIDENGTMHEDPADLSLEGMSLAVLFSTSIACANPSYEVIVQGQAFNSTTTQTPDIPADNATINIGNGSVYNFIYGQNYTLTKGNISQTYASRGSACSDTSALSPYILANGGACLFLRWEQTAKVLVDLMARINSSLQIDRILHENSSFFYRVSFPTWSNETLNYDPTYVAELHGPAGSPPNPHGGQITITTTIWGSDTSGSGGTDIFQMAAVSGVAFIGVAMLVVALFERRRTVNPVRATTTHSFSAP